MAQRNELQGLDNTIVWEDESEEYSRIHHRFDVEHNYAQIVEPLFKAYPDSFPADHYDIKSYEKAFHQSRSRQYELEAKGHGALALVPYMDMLNHQWGGGEWELEDEAVIMKAGRSYRAGEQVFINYGGKANDVYLRVYGFVEEGGLSDEVMLKLPSMTTLGPNIEEVKFNTRAQLSTLMPILTPIRMLTLIMIEGVQEEA